MAKPRPMRLEDLFAMQVIGQAAISPDGTRVAYELKRFDFAENRNVQQLMLLDAATGVSRPITDAAQRSDSLPRWSPDGARLAFLSDREKGSTLWVMPMDGGEPRRLTDCEGRVSDFAWSPDGRSIAYVYQPLNEREQLERDDKRDELKRRPQYKHITRLLHKFDGVGYWNGHYAHVHIISAKGGKPRQLSDGPFDDREPRFSPDGQLVSFVSNRRGDPDRDIDQSDIYAVSARGGRLRQLTRGPGYRSQHAWSPDGRSIAYVGSACKPGDWWKVDNHLWELDVASGRARELSGGIDNSCDNMTIGDVAGIGFDASPPIWYDAGQRIAFVVSEHGATRLYSVGVKRRDVRLEIGGNIRIHHIQRTGPTGSVAINIGSATNPADLYVTDLEHDGDPRRLTHVNQELLTRAAASAPREFWLKSGSTKLQCWMLAPPDFREDRRYPAILQIHGGPQAQYGYSFMHEMQVMAARGYVVAYCNPRGSSGYGLKHRRCIVGDWGSVDYDDVKKLADWLFSRPFVDPKRVGVTGGSYGGFMTNWIVGHEKRFAAAVTQRSCVNFESMVGTSDFGPELMNTLGGAPWRGFEKLRRQSPLIFAEKMRTPLLIVHSEQDLRCPIEQAQQLFTALKFLGCEVELVAFEGESHGLSRGGRPQNRAERLKRILGWFDRYLQPGGGRRASRGR